MIQRIRAWWDRTLGLVYDGPPAPESMHDFYRRPDRYEEAYCVLAMPPNYFTSQGTNERSHRHWFDTQSEAREFADSHPGTCMTFRLSGEVQLMTQRQRRIGDRIVR